jgi:CRP-like cAMP-binding protein/flavin-dependent dehydrogenase
MEQMMDDLTFIKRLTSKSPLFSSPLKLDNGSRVAVIGGGPAGSLFSYFLLSLAKQIDLKISVDIYEPRDFNVPGPLGCNMCGGVLYESLVQSLAVEGINLPTTIVQRGMEYNMLHLDNGKALIHTPRREKRIAATFRGIGPRGLVDIKGGSLDGYLLQAALDQGAQHVCSRVEEVRWDSVSAVTHPADKLVQIRTHSGQFYTYNFLAVTAGVNTALLKQFCNMDFGYQPPQTTKLVVREYFLGEEVVTRYFGSTFHAFLLDIPGLDYGAIIPKGDYVTICLLSSHKELNANAMEIFLSNPAVKRALPSDFSPSNVACLCGPRINVKGSKQPYGDRIIFIGDSGVSRLYKDGIGAAYRSAKIAAGTAIFHGISASAFKKYYLPFCRKMEMDNQIGKLLFKVAGLIQKMNVGQQFVLNMISMEQQGKADAERGMSTLMWDMLTGGAPYKEVLMCALHPAFWTRMFWNVAVSLIPTKGNQSGTDTTVVSLPQNAPISQIMEANTMHLRALGKVYQNGETIVCQGEIGDCMYVVQDGYVEVVANAGTREVQLAILGKNEFFGEMAIFEHEIRSATVRALGPARILTVDRINFLRRIHEDPTLAYRLMEVMSNRVRRLSGEVTQLKYIPSGSDVEEYFTTSSKHN